jgi:tetratricopeptide (TPR) repeat protein
MANHINLKQASSLLQEDVVLLCGAGISIPGPTALPTGDDLRDQTIVALLRNEENAELVDRLMASPCYRAMLPEATLQEVGYFAQGYIDRFIAAYLKRAPHNHLHRFISSKFPLIFTTNFDLCLEACGARQVYHLHGSADRPDTLQNKLWRLGKTEESTLRTFKLALSGKTLLIVGYSMRDSDVLSAIAPLPDLRVVYLSHQGYFPAALGLLQGQVLCTKGTLEALYGLPTPQLSACVRSPPRPRQPSRSSQALSLLYLANTIGDLALFEELHAFYASGLRGKLQLRALAIYAETLRASQRFPDALAVCRAAQTSPSYYRSSNLDVASNILAIEALAEDEGGGDKLRARRLIREAIAAMTKFGRVSRARLTPPRVAIWRAKLANNLGNIERELGNALRAERLYRYSMRIKLELSEEVAAAQTASNLSVLLITQHRLAEAHEMLRYVVQTLSKSMETYLCRSSLFDNAIALSNFLGLDLSGLEFGRVRLDDLRAAVPDEKSPARPILDALEGLNDIARKHAILL